MAPLAHPIHTGDFYINTQPLQRLTWVVQRWICADLMGGYIWGWPRVGKTHAIQYLQNRLTTRSGEAITSFFVTSQDPYVPGDLKFYQYICTSLDISHHGRISAASLYGTLVTTFKAAANTNSERRIVLFFDEAHLMLRMHYILLLGIVNDLRKHGVRPLIISVGSNELAEKVKLYETPADAQIRHRFFHACHRMYGLRGDAEVRHALGWFDRPAPETGLKNSLVADRVPDLYANGWRLSQHAALFWSTFTSSVKDHSEHGWWMAYFTITARLLLRDFLRPDGQVNAGMIKGAIRASGVLGAVFDSGDELSTFKDA